MEVILLLVENIGNGNKEVVKLLLEKLPIEALSVERSDSLIAQLLNVCALKNRPEEAKLAYSRWLETYPSQEISFYAKLFENNLIELDTFKFLATVFTDSCFIEVVSDLCLGDSSQNLIRTLDNVFHAYGEQTPWRLEIALQEADARGNFVVYNYIHEKLKPFRESVEKPVWVNSHSEDLPMQEELEERANEILQQISTEDVTLPEEDTLVNYMVAGMALDGVSIENIEEAKLALRGLIPNVSAEQLNEITKGRLEDSLVTENLAKLQHNTELFRILGPSNPEIDATKESFLTGQDRMFLCQLYDYDEEELEYEDWFTGFCDVCSKKIENYWWAVRVPRAQGGWSGCYCNFEHARQDIVNDETPRIADIAILDVVEDKVRKVGIQDRI